MAVNSTHPLYAELLPVWQVLRDCYVGERAIKLKTHIYLKPTPGMVLDGYYTGNQDALAAYDGYMSRANFPDFFTIGVQTLVGILNSKEPEIELPPQLEYLRKEATLTKEGLPAVLRKIQEEQLISGRVGLLADLPVNPDQLAPKQYISLWQAEKILNWDDGSFNQGFNKLNLVVLDESGQSRISEFEWHEVKKYRILSLGAVGPNEPMGTYRSGTSSETASEAVAFTNPTLKGQTLNEIPFVFCGPKDIAIDPDSPPLESLANLCLSIYRLDADYRHCLFMQGQDTLVVIGGVSKNAEGEALRVGAGARIDVDVGGDAKYIGVESQGLSELRMALDADKQLAAVRTGQLLQPGKMSMESGEALKTRVAGQTATLTSIAITSAGALEQLLRVMAMWQGGDPSLVKVKPNLDFTNVSIKGQDLVQIQTARSIGFPLSAESVHQLAVEHGLTTKTYEEELALIKAEDPILRERAAEVAAAGKNLTGNNPQAAAGGPAKSVKGEGEKSNAQM